MNSAFGERFKTAKFPVRSRFWRRPLDCLRNVARSFKYLSCYVLIKHIFCDKEQIQLKARRTPRFGYVANNKLCLHQTLNARKNEQNLQKHLCTRKPTVFFSAEYLTCLEHFAAFIFSFLTLSLQLSISMICSVFRIIICITWWLQE